MVKASLVPRIMILFIMLTFFNVSCSLDYFSKTEDDITAPEFIFHNAGFTRLQNNKKTTQMTVVHLEQYNEQSVSAGKDAVFTLYDENEELSVTGSCDLMSADTNKDEYYFFGNVLITSYEQNAQITADNLRWIGAREEFSAGVQDIVSISVGNLNSDSSDIQTSKEGTKLFVEGTGFSASGNDFSYSFSGPVSGRIIEN